MVGLQMGLCRVVNCAERYRTARPKATSLVSPQISA